MWLYIEIVCLYIDIMCQYRFQNSEETFLFNSNMKTVFEEIEKSEEKNNSIKINYI